MAQTSTMGGSLTVIANGDRLKKLRKDKGLRQHEIEKESGVPPGRLTRYESSAPVPLDHLDKLTSYYNVPAREITNAESATMLLGLAMRIARLFEGNISFESGERA